MKLVDVIRLKILKPNLALIYTLGNAQGKKKAKRISIVLRVYMQTIFFLVNKTGRSTEWKIRLCDYKTVTQSENLRAKFSRGGQIAMSSKCTYDHYCFRSACLYSLCTCKHSIYTFFQASLSSSESLFTSEAATFSSWHMLQDKAKFHLQNKPFDLGLIHVPAANTNQKQKSNGLLLGTMQATSYVTEQPLEWGRKQLCCITQKCQQRPLREAEYRSGKKQMSGHFMVLHIQMHLPTHVLPFISKRPQSEQNSTQSHKI